MNKLWEKIEDLNRTLPKVYNSPESLDIIMQLIKEQVLEAVGEPEWMPKQKDYAHMKDYWEIQRQQQNRNYMKEEIRKRIEAVFAKET